MTTMSTPRLRSTAVHFPPWVGSTAIGLLLLAGLTVTWTGLRLPGLGDPSDVLIVMCFGICTLLVVFGDLRYSVPVWTFILPTAVILCVLVRELDPPPYYLQVLRLQFEFGAPASIVKAIFWIFAMVIVPQSIIACVAVNSRVAVWAMGAYVTGTTISSFIAVIDLTGLTNIGRSLSGNLYYAATNLTEDSSNRMPGLTDHPNSLGFTAVISIPILVFLMATMQRRWIAAIALVVVFGGIIASGSRGAQIVAPVALVASLLWLPRRSSGTRSVVVRTLVMPALAVLAAGLAVLFSLPSAIRDSVLRVTSFDSLLSTGNASNTGRLTLIGEGLQDWRMYPIFGAGLRHIVEAHNIYVQLLASGGLVLLVAMFAFWWFMIRDCWRLSRIGVDVARFLMISMVGWLALGLVENQLTERGIYFAVGGIAGLAAVYLPQWPNAADHSRGAKSDAP